MNENNLTTYLARMTDGYRDWQHADRRRCRRRHLAVAALAVFLAVAVNAFALALPQRYSSFAGSYGPDAVPVVEQMLSRQ